jgi:hypothetical protein
MPKNVLTVLMLASILYQPLQVIAAEIPIDKVLPAPACANGWVMDGKVALYDRDNLFERINGESELYVPYGFDRLASARYASVKDPQTGFDADVYRMGSLLDAFGIYANYRKREDAGVKIGADGTISASQLFFYQDRYLVRLQATGPKAPEQDAFLACARTIARNLPHGTGRPRVLEVFAVPAVVPKSERYSASSLLGYDFFHRGLMADVLLGGEQVQLFLVTEDSPETARTAFVRYRDYLKSSEKELQATEAPGRASLQGVDPLYGRVIAVQTGRFIIGAVRFTDRAAVQQLVEQLSDRTGGL